MPYKPRYDPLLLWDLNGGPNCWWIVKPRHPFSNPSNEYWYRNDPKFLVWANSVDPDRSSLIRVYTICHSVCIFWMHYSMVVPQCSNFKIITPIFRVSKYLGILQYFGFRCFRNLRINLILREQKFILICYKNICSYCM